MEQIIYNDEQSCLNEISDLIYWFDDYDAQVSEYNRCQRLGLVYDRNIVELDQQAVKNADRITQLRQRIIELKEVKECFQ